MCLLSLLSEIDHVWIGGQFKQSTDSDGKHWVWASSGKSIAGPPDSGEESAFPPWSDGTHKVGMDCLNMDRWEHDVAKIYGLECHHVQHFLCEKGKYYVGNKRFWLLICGIYQRWKMKKA